MSAVNNINLFGRISQLDFTIVNENLAIIEFTLAVHDYHDQENDVDHVQWIRCKLYGKPKIENIANNMEKGQQAIVSLVSSVNVPKNEWLKANFVLNKNFIVFEKGDLIASKVIDAANTTSAIDGELRNLLNEVNQKAIRNGLLTDSEGQVGSIDFVNFYQIVEKVKSKDKKVKIEVHAKEEIWRNDRLGSNISFSIENVSDEGMKNNE